MSLCLFVWHLLLICPYALKTKWPERTQANIRMLYTVKFVKETNVKAPVSVWLWLVSQRLYVGEVCGHRSISVLFDYLGSCLNANMTLDNQTKMAVSPAVKTGWSTSFITVRKFSVEINWGTKAWLTFLSLSCSFCYLLGWGNVHLKHSYKCIGVLWPHKFSEKLHLTQPEQMSNCFHTVWKYLWGHKKRKAVLPRQMQRN